MPVRKFPTGKWLFALAAACVIGVGFFMWKGRDQNQEIAQVQGEEEGREGKNGEDVGAKYLSPEKKNIGAKYLSPEGREGKMGEDKRGEEEVRDGKSKEEVAQGLKEIPREELVAYLLEEDSDLIENIN